MNRVKEGGPNPTGNAALAVLLQTAKQYDVPKEIIDRNIKKASDKSQADFVDMTYEVNQFSPSPNPLAFMVHTDLA